MKKKKYRIYADYGVPQSPKLKKKGIKIMKKEKYIIPEMEIVMFESEDIVTVSLQSMTPVMDENGNISYYQEDIQ